MFHPPLVLGVDCSTHGAKVCAWTLDGEPAAEARVPVALLSPHPGWYEQHAPDWFNATTSAIAALPSEVRARVRAIGVTHQRETFVGVDQNGTPVRNAIVWMDERAWSEVAFLRESIGEEAFHATTGKPISLTPSIAKLQWIRRHEPSTFRAAVRWLDVFGYLVCHLVGKDVTSAGSAEAMGLLELRTERWSTVLLDHVGLDETLMPKIVAAGSVVGSLQAHVAEQCGLGSGIPVVGTAGDGQVAAVAAGVFNLELAYLNLGTAVVSGTVGHSFLQSRAFRTMGGGVPGTYLFESDIKGGTFTLDWLRERLLRGSMSVQDLETQAAKIAPGADGLVCVPYFAGVMNPYWDDDASGVLLGLRDAHGPAHVFRSMLEGVALEQRLHLREIERATGVPIRELRVMGGGASSDLWCSMIADVLRRPVVRTRSREATSLGAAMIAAAAVGLFSSVEAAASVMGGTAERFEPGPNADRYDDLFDTVYVGLYPSLRSAMTNLARFTRGRPYAPEGCSRPKD